MKKLAIALIYSALLGIGAPSTAQDASRIVETDSHSVFTGLFRAVWARLRAISPPQQESARSTAVYTVGIRGAESTDTLLKPYWKGDLTRDEAFQAELQKFGLAQIKMDRGELAAAVKSFDEFLQEYQNSNLRPNAQFGKSISLAGLGQTEQARTSMQQFIDQNPTHPLVEDAKQIVAELQ